MKILGSESARAVCSQSETSVLTENDIKSVIKTKRGHTKSTNLLEEGVEVAKAAIEEVADVREDIVEDLKRKVDAGEYYVPGSDIAEMMLRRLRADKMR